MIRLVALLILVIPGILAMLGIKLMRDMLFGILQSPFPFLWLQFIDRLLVFLGWLGLIGGFLFRRDQRNNKVQDRFKK